MLVNFGTLFSLVFPWDVLCSRPPDAFIEKKIEAVCWCCQQKKGMSIEPKICLEPLFPLCRTTTSSWNVFSKPHFRVQWSKRNEMKCEKKSKSAESLCFLRTQLQPPICNDISTSMSRPQHNLHESFRNKNKLSKFRECIRIRNCARQCAINNRHFPPVPEVS